MLLRARSGRLLLCGKIISSRFDLVISFQFWPPTFPLIIFSKCCSCADVLTSRLVFPAIKTERPTCQQNVDMTLQQWRRRPTLPWSKRYLSCASRDKPGATFTKTGQCVFCAVTRFSAPLKIKNHGLNKVRDAGISWNTNILKHLFLVITTNYMQAYLP